MTLFEKIFWTLGAISVPCMMMFSIAALNENEIVAVVLAIPFIVLSVIFLLDVLVCEVILRMIWKVDFTLFPTLFD